MTPSKMGKAKKKKKKKNQVSPNLMLREFINQKNLILYSLQKDLW